MSGLEPEGAGERFRRAVAAAATARAGTGETPAAPKPALPPGWSGVLARLPVTSPKVSELIGRAARNRTSFLAELAAARLVPEAVIYEAMAAELGLRFATCIDPRRLLLGDRECLPLLQENYVPRPLLMRGDDGRPVLAIAPTEAEFDRLRRRLAGHPGLAARIRIVPPQALRAALVSRARPELMSRAKYQLLDALPAYSSLTAGTGWQAVVIGLAMAGYPAIMFLAPLAAVVAAHVLLSLAFLSCVGLRLAAFGDGSPADAAAECDAAPGDLPIYTVLVALYREAEIVPELLTALGRLKWPRSKLDIKLVCEADDRSTLEAIRAFALPPCVEIVEVPGCEPRTKPKALSYALPLARGEFVVLYDAEDKPHPEQLIEAWQRFRDGDASLACVQAPLVVYNGRRGIIAKMFAFEYAALFRGILPFLARRRLILPLGGTSNHFRRAVLEQVGAWDPFNVTEDADLGLRLRRFGYRTETISRPTYEAGPEKYATWLPQRTRWFKGWMQTWLVHMRHPGRLAAELGAASFSVSQILFAGMILSALMHPVLIATGVLLALHVATLGLPELWLTPLAMVDAANVACGYLAFLALGWTALAPRDRLGFWKVILFTPIYWLMMSVAAWRAFLQLLFDPHRWEKTPHPVIAVTAPV